MDLDVNKLSKNDCLSLTLFGLISHWPSFDRPMTFKKNFGDEILKIYFSFSLKVTTRAAKIWKFLSKMIFFKPVPNFRVLSLLLSSYFLNFCTAYFLRFFSQSFSQFFLDFQIFKNFKRNFQRFFLYFRIFLKIGFYLMWPNPPLWDFSYGKC